MAQGQSCGAVGEDASGNAYIVRLLLLGVICLHCVFLLLCMGKQQGILALLPTQETQMEFQGFVGIWGAGQWMHFWLFVILPSKLEKQTQQILKR